MGLTESIEGISKFAFDVDVTSREMIELLVPAIPDMTKLDMVKLQLSEYIRKNFEESLSKKAFSIIEDPVMKAMDEAISYREYLKEENRFNVEAAITSYNRQMAEASAEGLNFSLITEDFISAATSTALGMLETRRQILNTTLRAEKTLREGLDRLYVDFSMSEEYTFKCVRAIGDAIRIAEILSDAKYYVDTHKEIYEDEKYQINIKVGDFEVYQAIADSAKGNIYIGDIASYQDRNMLLSLESAGYIRIFSRDYYVTTSKYEQEAIKELYLREHPEEREVVVVKVETDKSDIFAKAEEELSKGQLFEAAVDYAAVGKYRDGIRKSMLIWRDYILPEKQIDNMDERFLAVKEDGSLYLHGEIKSRHRQELNEIDNAVKAYVDEAAIILQANGKIFCSRDDVCTTNNPFETPIIKGNGSELKGVVDIQYGGSHLAALLSNGRVSCYGYNKSGECNTEGWRDITRVLVNYDVTAGLKADGTVLLTGQIDLFDDIYKSWTGIVNIALSNTVLVGLNSEGKVLFAAKNGCSSCFNDAILNWRNVVRIIAEWDCLFGITIDGEVLYSGEDQRFADICKEKKEVVDVIPITNGLLFLKADGRVEAFSVRENRYDISDWHDIIYVRGDNSYVYGVKNDGQVVIAGAMDKAPSFSDIGSWKLFENINTIREKRMQLVETERVKYRTSLEQELASLKQELSSLKGLFTNKKRRELEERISQVVMELQ